MDRQILRKVYEAYILNDDKPEITMDILRNSTDLTVGNIRKSVTQLVESEHALKRNLTRDDRFWSRDEYDVPRNEDFNPNEYRVEDYFW
ncbi:hypothetical protein C8U37_107163 [Trichococcus patagoniensis]|uniref:Uncharacterized protein n=1 Tax=Trichococcus patagoniensis TaxID=382641 RepID=A0A2T5ILU3_9LACT|nr:hypothetical protein [Trichococcus patagoniensis]PTQ84795.1 hypothetical protein C8U37_107163 [Trichococcus patagoniensis]